MSKYQVFDARGEYVARQLAANEAGCDVHIEQHMNSKLNDREEDSDNYACVLVAHNASAKSKAIAATYAAKVAAVTGLRNAGVVQVGYMKNGDRNLRYTNMPAVLLEPLFISDRSQADFASSPAGQELLAQAIVDTVKEHFPNGAKVSLGPGHKYQPGKNDPGAPAANGNWEAELCDQVCIRAKRRFEGDSIAPPVDRLTALERRVDRLEGVAK